MVHHKPVFEFKIGADSKKDPNCVFLKQMTLMSLQA